MEKVWGQELIHRAKGNSNRHNDVTTCVCTYNSGRTLERCLRSIRNNVPGCRLIIVDHNSNDETVNTARRFNAEVIRESTGLGHARQRCFDITESEYLVFVDSDVELVRQDFLEIAKGALSMANFGAVVGMALRHRFQYGLPAGLLVLRMKDFEGKVVPDYVDARETFFIQRRLQSLGLKVFYVPDSMIHRSQFRKFKPEWEGANTRILPDSAPRQLLLALQTILLLSLNSRSVRTLAYSPIFYLKFLRGFADPKPWIRLNRQVSFA